MWKFPIPSKPEAEPQASSRVSKAKLVTAFGQPKRIAAAEKPDPRFAPKLAQWRGK